MNGKFIPFCAGSSETDTMPGTRNIDAILFNAPNLGKSHADFIKHKKLVTALNPTYRKCDSGGFQLLLEEMNDVEITHIGSKPMIWTKDKKNLAPEHVLYWAKQIDATSIVALDRPVNKIVKSKKNIEQIADEEKREFLSKIGFNIQWAADMSTLREKYNMQNIDLYIPIQAYNIEQFDLFYKNIAHCNFDGFCLPTRTLTSVQILIMVAKLFFLNRVNKIHILGSFALGSIVVGTYLARHYFDVISIDATTWRENARHCTYANCYDLKQQHIGNDVIIKQDQLNTCRCPWCADTSYATIKNMPYTDKYNFLKRHNFWVVNEFAKNAYNACTTLKSLEEFLKIRCRDFSKYAPLIDALNLLDIYREHDFESFSQAVNDLTSIHL